LRVCAFSANKTSCSVPPVAQKPFVAVDHNAHQFSTTAKMRFGCGLFGLFRAHLLGLLISYRPIRPPSSPDPRAIVPRIVELLSKPKLWWFSDPATHKHLRTKCPTTVFGTVTPCAGRPLHFLISPVSASAAQCPPVGPAANRRIMRIKKGLESIVLQPL